MNFEIKAQAAKMVAYLEDLEKCDDEELEFISNMRNINAFLKSSTRLLPKLLTKEIRQLVCVTQMRRKRPLTIEDSAEYDPHSKTIEMNPQDELKRLRFENEQLNKKLTIANTKLRFVQSALDQKLTDEVEEEDEV